MSGLDDIMQYMVDVSVFDNHAKSLEEEGFKLGKLLFYLNELGPVNLKVCNQLFV